MFLFLSFRAIHRLVDKGQHDERLADLESMTLWFSIVATPLHFASAFTNAALVRGAIAEGRIFTDSTRMVATILNFSTLGIDAVLVGCGLANLIDKLRKDQLTPLDVLQFSMSVFFFTNTLIKPQMAQKIIERAQDAHIQRFTDSMSSDAIRATFEKFFVENIKDGGASIATKSHIVRTINRIQDVNAVFGGLQEAVKIELGGRKGKTLMVTDQSGQTTRISPNK